MDSKSEEKVFLAAIFVSLFSILPLNIGFYTFTRLVVSISSVVAVLALRKKDKSAWIVFALLAILYNPVIPVYLHDKGLWTVVNASTAFAFVWAYRSIADKTNLIDAGLFWISRLGLLGCLTIPVVAYILMQTTGEQVYVEKFFKVTLSFWASGIVGAVVINKVFFSRTSLWISKKDI